MDASYLIMQSFSISCELSFRKSLLVEIRSLVCPICPAQVISYENTILVEFVASSRMMYYDFTELVDKVFVYLNRHGYDAHVRQVIFFQDV